MGDLKAFFDTVNHDVLMSRLERRIKDRQVLSLIGKYLRAGVVMPSGRLAPTCAGVPQGGYRGGPLSPLLANIDLVAASLLLRPPGCLRQSISAPASRFDSPR